MTIFFKFRQKYGESIPDEWLHIVENRPEMFSFTQQPANMSIVYKNTSESKLSANEMFSPRTKSHQPASTGQQNGAHEDTCTNADTTNLNSIVQENDIVDELPPMKFPWDQPWWRIKITAAYSPVDIWGCDLNSEDWVCTTNMQTCWNLQ